MHPESELSVESGAKRCTLTRSCSFGSFDDTASEQPLWDGNVSTEYPVKDLTYISDYTLQVVHRYYESAQMYSFEKAVS